MKCRRLRQPLQTFCIVKSQELNKFETMFSLYKKEFLCQVGRKETSKGNLNKKMAMEILHSKIKQFCLIDTRTFFSLSK